MPLYRFRCSCGLTAERLASMGTEQIQCPVCGSTAAREHVYRFDVVGPTVDTRGKFRRYQEASAEMEYAEQKTGVPAPKIWPLTKRRVKEMNRRFEAPYRRER